MITIMDPYFFHGHDFVRVLAPGPVHLSIGSLPNLFDSFVMPNCPCHVGPFSQTHTRRNRYRFTNIVITICVAVRVLLVLRLPVLQLVVRIGIVRRKGLVVEVRLSMIGLLLRLLLPTALVLIILMRRRIAIVRRFPSVFRSSSHRCHLWTPPVAFLYWHSLFCAVDKFVLENFFDDQRKDRG